MSYRIENQTDIIIIRNVYNSVTSQEMSKQQFDNALKAGYKFIIIEPTQLSNDVLKFIGVGHYLSKTAIVSGLMSIGTGMKLIIVVSFRLYIIFK